MRAIRWLAVLLPALRLAGVPLQASLEELAAQADHLLVGRVTGVDMIDAQGRPVTDAGARTGPGLDTTIRLLITVDEVLVSNAAEVPDVIAVPLDPFLHYTLGRIRAAHEGDTQVRLVLLKGADFSPVKRGVFLRPLEDRQRALELHRAAHP